MFWSLHDIFGGTTLCLPRTLLAWLLILAGAAGCTSAAGAASTPRATVSLTPSVLPETATPQVAYASVDPNPLQGTYLANPGIGWQKDGSPDSSINLPETVAYAVRQTIAWNILNPADGQFDWTALDSALQEAAARGEQFSFRVYSMAGEGYGGAKVPDWVLADGAILTPSGEPDYSNCTYQEKWGDFVNALIGRYDGNPSIAFIDVSGYGDFNEWSWQSQTEWDEEWKNAVDLGKPDAAAFRTLDGQARRRLADTFIGGQFAQHECRDSQGQIHTLAYSYAGFQKTQLVMPFAGINQSTQYVRWRRPQVGFRYDCLGRAQDARMVMQAAQNVWRAAPVVFELCSADQFTMTAAAEVMQQTHGSLVHDNGYSLDLQSLEQLMLGAGYRYVLKSASVSERSWPGGAVKVSMDWQNAGSAPSYPRMGQDFKLHVILADGSGRTVLLDNALPASVASWMPAGDASASPPDNVVSAMLQIPADLQPGTYQVQVAIIDQRTGQPIQLGFEAPNEAGRYFIAQVAITP